MEFFTVWWFDILLAMAILPQLALTVLSLMGEGAGGVRAVLSVIGTVFSIASVLGLLFIEGELTDVLIVLMMIASVTSLGAYVESRMAKNHEEKEGEVR